MKLTAKRMNYLSLAMSIIYTLLAIIHILDFLPVFTTIAMLIFGVILSLFLYFKKYIPERIYSYLELIIFLSGSFLIAFEYNLYRIINPIISEGYNFFDGYFYSNNIGIMLAIFQIFVCITLILKLAHFFTTQISKRLCIFFLFTSGLLGVIFKIYESVYLDYHYGNNSESIYIIPGIMYLLWFLTHSTIDLQKNN